MTNLEIIRRACIAANPSIMELGFGCQLKEPAGFIETVFRIFPAIKIGNEWRRGALTDFGQQDDISIWEILGRPIRLADIIFAIQNRPIDREWSRTWSILGTGAFFPLELVGTGDKGFNEMKVWGNPSWNLLKDDLADNPQTWDFLAELLK